MVVGRDSVRGRSELHLYGSLGHHPVAFLQSAEDFHPVAIVLTECHLLLAISLLVHLDIDVMHALLFRYGSERQGHHVRSVLGDEEYFSVGTLNNIACIVEFEYDWNVGVVYLCRTSIRLYVSAHISDVIKAVTVAGTEFRTLYLVQFLELALWNFCAEIEMLVLGYDGKRLPQHSRRR